MTSRTNDRFWQCFGKLPLTIQRLAKKNYRLWRDNPNHPSLHFKRLAGHTSVYSVRVNDDYRALGCVEGEVIVWVWIGNHAEYDKLLKRM